LDQHPDAGRYAVQWPDDRRRDRRKRGWTDDDRHQPGDDGAAAVHRHTDQPEDGHLRRPLCQRAAGLQLWREWNGVWTMGKRNADGFWVRYEQPPGLARLVRPQRESGP